MWPRPVMVPRGLVSVWLLLVLLAMVAAASLIACTKPPVAQLSAQPISGPALLEVAFRDHSENRPTQWDWDFGDGATSHEQNPSHTYTKAGTYTVRLTATNDKGSSTAESGGLVAVSPGALDHLVLEPASVTLAPQGQRGLIAKAFDAYGNEIRSIALSWRASPDAGSVSADGVFVASTRTGSYEAAVSVAATYGRATRSAAASVTIVPGGLEAVTVVPPVAEVKVGGTQQFQARGVDRYGNEVPGITFRWTATAGTVDGKGLFAAGTRAGPLRDAIKAEATQDGVTRAGTASVTIRPDPLERITVEPRQLTVDIGAGQRFTVTAFDRYGNPLPASVSWTYPKEAGSLDPQGNFVAGTRAGTFSIAAQVTEGTVSRTQEVSVTVLPDPIKHLRLSPDPVTLSPNGSQQFAAQALDQYLNEVRPATFRWSVVNGGGIIGQEGTFFAGSRPGTFRDTVRVEATYKGVTQSASASITIPAPQFAPVLTPRTPAPVPGLGYLVYEDDFSANLGWWEGDTGGRRYYLQDGAYHIEMASGGGRAWASDRSLSQLGDFSLEVTLSKISEPQDSQYGIAFEIGNTKQDGFILVSPQGRAFFWKDRGPGTYVNSIVVFERAVALAPGESLDRARLKVERRGATWTVWVNDSMVASVTDTAEPLSQVGLRAGGQNIHATFDNLKVYSSSLPRAPPLPSGIIVISDPFDGWNRGWPFYGQPQAIYFEKGALHLTAAQETGQSTYNRRIPKTVGFAYQADLSFPRAVSGADGRLMVKKEQGTVAFTVRPTRQFEVGYFAGDAPWTSLVDRRFSSAIEGAGRTNRLLVIGQEGYLEFYANEVFLARVPDPYPHSPVIGIGVAIWGRGSQMAVDNVTLYTLQPLVQSETKRIAVEPPRINPDMEATKRLFAVFAFLNAAGYDEGRDTYGFTPMRLRVRQALAGLDPALLQRMKAHYQGRQRAGLGNWSVWNSYGLTLEGAGPFRETARTADGLRGTADLLNEFYARSNLEALWQEAQPEYLAHARSSIPQVVRAGADVLAYVRQPTPPDKAFYYVPNFLMDYGAGLNSSYGDRASIVLAPQNDDFSFLETARHEFLHTAVDPAVEKNAAIIKAKEALFAGVKPEVKELYDTWPKFVEECLVRAITIRIAALYDPAWQPTGLTETNLADFFLIRPFLEALKGYEASPVPFEEYAAQVLRAIP